MFSRSPMHTANSTWLIGVTLAALFMVMLGIQFIYQSSATAASPNTAQVPDGGEFRQVKRGKFEIVCREEGELHPVTVASLTFLRAGKINYLVPEGTFVKKGDKIAGLETKDLDDEIKLVKDELALAEPNLATLEQNRDLQTQSLNNDLLTQKDAAALGKLKNDDVLSHPWATEMDDARNQVDGGKAAYDAAFADLESDKILAAAGFSKRAELESKEVALAKAAVELERAKNKAKVLLAGSKPYDKQKSALEMEQADLELKLKEIDVADQIDSLEAKVKTAKHAIEHGQRKLARRNRDLQRSQLYAPYDGIVVLRTMEWLGNRKVEVGERVWQNMTAIELPDYDKMKVVTQVPESFIRKLKVREDSKVPGTGSKARVKVNTLPGRVYNAEVIRIDGWARDRNEKLSEADVKAQGLSGVRVFAVDVELDEIDTQHLRDGFRATVEFPVEEMDNIISIPFRAVRNHDGYPSVQVLQENGLQWRQVKPGIRSIDQVEIVSGLNEGETVLIPQQPQTTEVKPRTAPRDAAPVKSNARGNRSGDGPPDIRRKPKEN